MAFLGDASYFRQVLHGIDLCLTLTGVDVGVLGGEREEGRTLK